MFSGPPSAASKADKIQPCDDESLSSSAAAAAQGFFQQHTGCRLFADLEKELTEKPAWDRLAGSSSLDFGSMFTDHMLTVQWSFGQSWGRPRIGPLKLLELHPAAKVLHYATSVFEGMKAFRGSDGRVRLFRPELNMERMLGSAERTCLPAFSKRELLACIKELLRVDRAWVPQECDLGDGCSLYLRPTLMGTTGTLGVDRPRDALLFVIMSPVQSYFEDATTAVHLLADGRYIRSSYGGVGDHKMACNYAAPLRIQEEAKKLGYPSVLWLHGEDARITEAGTMNVFFVLELSKGERELVTPPLDGLILPGVYRQSVIELGSAVANCKVSERVFTMQDLVKASSQGRLLEAFGTGTAASIAPIGSIHYKDRCTIEIPTLSQKAPLYRQLHQSLSDIQFGRVAHEWADIV
ncbi:unnamed protein product [Notodromas monacha]|uniref:Branched-chain-amino-acid aminotransferase n=1 Tax=Notodromas monacha TaxID=399045 RepID=A0A7R9BJJ8_9CRUS|nr:unnamed protein product [Notodromas monacha]CAG0915291.1 unnamed protein product [Notodromas monacha]